MPFASGAIHVQQHLVDLCVAYDPAKQGYIRNILFPRKVVAHETDLIATVSKGDILRLYDLDVSARSQIPEVTYRTSADLTYQCLPKAAKAELNPLAMKNADAAYKHEIRQTKQANTSMGIQMEYFAVKQRLRSTSVLTQYRALVAGTTAWDAFASTDSTPIEDMQAAIALIRIQCGVSRNAGAEGRIVVAMHEYTWISLQQHPNVLSRITFNPNGTGAVLTREILAKILDINVEDIHITPAQYTSSQQGETDAFKAFLGADVVIAYVDSDPENDQALGHEFAFDGLAGDDPFLVRRWIEEGVGPYLHTEWIGVACMVDYKVTNPKAGFLFTGAINAADTTRYGNPSLV